MPRPIPVKWTPLEAVELSQEDEVSRDLAADRKLWQDLNALAIFPTPELLSDLVGIKVQHAGWRKIEAEDSTGAQSNEQLRVVARCAGQLAERWPDVAHENGYALMGLLQGLSRRAEFELGRQLSRAEGGEDWVQPDLDVFAPDVIALAALAAVKDNRGRVQDSTLFWTVKHVVEAYERATGKTFTHNPKGDGDYDGGAHSDCDRFVQAVLTAIGEKASFNSVGGVLAKLKRARNKGPGTA